MGVYEMTDQNFKSVVTQYERLVFTICYQMVRDYHEAQNLTQDTFLSAYIHIDSCREDALKPWLARIAANKARDYLKSAYHRRVQTDGDTMAALRADSAPTPDEALASRETLETIREGIGALSEPYRGVAQLYYLEEKSTDEISALLGRPVKTIQTQLYRARNKLRIEIREEE